MISNGTDTRMSNYTSVLSAGGGAYLAYKGTKLICHKPVINYCIETLDRIDNSMFKEAAVQACSENYIMLCRPENLMKNFIDRVSRKYVNIPKSDTTKYKFDMHPNYSLSECKEFGIDKYIEYEPIGKLKSIGMQEVKKQNKVLKIFGTKCTNKFLDIKDLLATKFNKNHEKKLFEFLKGKNACFTYGAVYANLDKTAATVFHETGHALNYYNKGVGKILQTLQHCCVGQIGFVVAMASALLIPSQDDSAQNSDENNGIWSKTKRFLKKNCVGIAALSLTPTILEEGLASIKGYKMAKNLLQPNECKMLGKLYGGALLTYITTALAFTAGVFAANKIRNYFSDNNDV